MAKFVIWVVGIKDSDFKKVQNLFARFKGQRVQTAGSRMWGYFDSATAASNMFRAALLEGFEVKGSPKQRNKAG